MIEADFERARRRAHWNRVVAFFRGKPSLLLPFDLVRGQLDVKSVSYEGIREIPIESVIGSVNRYHDFDREFLPTTGDSADRWSRVRKMFDSDLGFPPITVYRIGEGFFVMDGNHRVSVARQLGMKSIEAEVINYQATVPIDKSLSIADLIIKKEYTDFLRQTRLHELRPQQSISFTRPGRYATLLEHIDKRRYFLGLELQRDIPYDEAVESWYDGLYRPLLSIFEEEDLLSRFPQRTAADLYVWVTNHMHLLREHFGDDIGLAEAARDLGEGEKRQHLVPRLLRKPRDLALSQTLTRSMSDAPALRELQRRLLWMERKGVGMGIEYRVPRLWIDGSETSQRIESPSATAFWRSSVDRVFASGVVPRIAGAHGEWSRQAVVYNLFVRSSCAFDHDGNGSVSVLNRQGLRETGTFLKAIALLPYIQQLGCNVVHLLPVCRIGVDGRKGSLGSPYAIANPYQLDETLSEPLVGIGPEAEFKAFVEAAHRLGLRVVVEFVFRTAAKDSAWAQRHPNWFYWIRDDVPDRDPSEPERIGYGSPIFPEADLDQLKKQVHEGCLDTLPPPPAAYQSLFVPPPAVDTIRITDGRILGDTRAGTPARIPGAFADWPPDDAQPPWGDVTYLRLYDRADFNYIAYNTIRMYDTKLAKPENAVPALWDRIAGILPHFQNRFGIDGAMIDMGHALPADLMARVISGARGVDPSFAFWEEHFTVRAESKSEGYNASIGNLWWRIHRSERLRSDLLEELAHDGLPLPFFATPETHNTPRCASRLGGIDQSRLSWILGAFLPAIPFIHSGFELGETMPVNTGLDFTVEEAAQYPEDQLPLYNAYAYAWNSDSNLIETIRKTLQVRKELEPLITDPSPSTFAIPECVSERCVCYVRHNGIAMVLILGNYSEDVLSVQLSQLPILAGTLEDRIHGVQEVIANGELRITLRPWQCLVFTGEAEDLKMNSPLINLLRLS